MKKLHADRVLIEHLHTRLRITPRDTTYDDQGSLIALDLSDLDLEKVPAELGQLNNLRTLDLSGNRLRGVPAELGQLTNLQRLSVNGNQLKEVPVELGQLTNLQILSLSGNQLRGVPAALGQLTNLQWLYLNANQLREVPTELGQLNNLRTLDLSGNRLREAPAELGQLTNLQRLYLSVNQLREVPTELGQLTNLQRLYLNANQLREVPTELGQLNNLQQLYLNVNQLREVPTELGQLTNLQILDLDGNQLREIPAELGQLTNLRTLDLSGNRLREVPIELGQLTNLQILDLDGNPDLLTLPPEIVEQGTPAILTFLQELHHVPSQRYEAKLILVGEGGIGKTSVLRAFQDLPFDPTLSTTHGIEIASLILPHPSLPEQSLTLNAWDFGGQQVYQATHQFFLTKRSLYLVAWNARLGGEQCRLDYWLNTIRVIAPEAPVLLVATHIDERAPDLDIRRYSATYPQIVDILQMSSKTGQGLPELKEAVAKHAATLPLMGYLCPVSWVRLEQELLALPEHHIGVDTYVNLCMAKGIRDAIAQDSLGSYLHDLGKILYFRDDPILRTLVILKPNWVTKAISRVLEDPATRARSGILVHADLPHIWANDEQEDYYDPTLYPVFLRLMERFELCYQIHPVEPWQEATHSLIPQLLSRMTPNPLPTWTPADGKVHVEMTYRFDFVPAGIMSWFIVRTHRYTNNLHWHEGGILIYQEHLARIELFPLSNELKIEVWGIEPRTFLVMLKDTLDTILSRFAGLQVRREVPCTCRQQPGETQLCQETYRYEEDLIRRIKNRVEKIQCRSSFREVSVHKLLYGIHESTITAVEQEILRYLRAIQETQDTHHSQQNVQLSALMQQVSQSRELTIRYFTRQWNLEMQKQKTECPTIFHLIPGSKAPFSPKNWISRNYKLFLLCQHPSKPHRVRNAKGYNIRQSKEWWMKVSPWLEILIRFLKVSVPAVGEVIDISLDENLSEHPHQQIALLERISQNIPYTDPLGPEEQLDDDSSGHRIEPALRTLHSFLNEADPQRHWDGLEKVVTEDGNIFWLCQEHAHPYRPQPLYL